MIRYVLGSKASRKTARALSKKITELQGLRCFYYERTPLRVWLRYDGLRWGNLSVEADALNGLFDCKFAAHKLASLQHLAEENVSVPAIVATRPFGSDTLQGSAFPMVFRKNFHRGGNDNPYVVMKKRSFDISRANGYDYAVRWIRKAKEYRIHVVDGRAIICQVKRKKLGADHDRMIRSESRGWVLCNHSLEMDAFGVQPAIKNQAIKAVSCLGLVFGAVDICVEKETNRAYVLEVNTAPGLKEENVAIYAANLIARCS